MGFLGDLAGGLASGTVKGTFEGIGSLAKDIRSAITGEISPDKKAEIESKLLEMESMANLGQIEVNKVEAGSSSIFVSGWRPALGWVGAVSLASYFIPQYLLAAVLWVKVSWAAQALAPFPIPEPGGLLELVMLMLGMGTVRMLEKIKGVNRN